MNCHDAREGFSDWVDEALTAEDRARVDAHLAQCADCRKELERFRETVALLHRVERPRAPVGFVDRVLEAARPAPWHRRLLQRLFLPLSLKLPAEAAALLLVAGLAVYVFQRTPELQQAARRDTFRSATRSEAPPATFSDQPPAPGVAESPRSALRDRPSKQQLGAEQKPKVAPEDSGLSTVQEAGKPAPPAELPAPAAPPASVERTLDVKKELEAQNFATPRAPEPPVSQSGPSPAEEGAKAAPAPAPPARAAAPVPSVEPKADVKKEAKAQGLAAPRAPESAPPQSPPAPATEGRADSERRSPAAPALRSGMRILPSADVAGRLAVKDRDAAERALGELLARSGGVVMARREEAGATVVEVAVPKTAYLEFSQGLARIGAWHPEGEASDLPPNVRVTLRLVQ
jgi:hypothetical protein